ncbi:MAG: hypothetical protein M8866_03095 [marine benthic group bacterium]|nr:hypothetical protein [Candidatus Benthicola marisminoris]
MGVRDPVPLVMGWIDSSWMVAVGAGGVILILLSFKRDDAIGPIFLITGIAMAILGFGGQILGVKL